MYHNARPLIIHTGLNRKERRKLAWQIKHGIKDSRYEYMLKVENERATNFKT